MGLAGFDISYVKMMHFAILEMPRGGSSVSVPEAGAMGVGGELEEAVVVFGSSQRGPETRSGEGKTRDSRYEISGTTVDGKWGSGGKA